MVWDGSRSETRVACPPGPPGLLGCAWGGGGVPAALRHVGAMTGAITARRQPLQCGHVPGTGWVCGSEPAGVHPHGRVPSSSTALAVEGAVRGPGPPLLLPVLLNALPHPNMYVLERVQHRVPEEALRVSAARPGPAPGTPFPLLVPEASWLPGRGAVSQPGLACSAGWPGLASGEIATPLPRLPRRDAATEEGVAGAREEVSGPSWRGGPKEDPPSWHLEHQEDPPPGWGQAGMGSQRLAEGSLGEGPGWGCPQAHFRQLGLGYGGHSRWSPHFPLGQLCGRQGADSGDPVHTPTQEPRQEWGEAHSYFPKELWAVQGEWVACPEAHDQ